MPAKKRIVRRNKEDISFNPSASWQEEKTVSDPVPEPIKKSSSRVRNIIFVLILVLALLFWKFKGYFIVATVNGQPVSRWELTTLLLRRFGDQSLDNIINERLILSAAKQKGIFVTPYDIDQKIEEVKKRLEGKMTIDEALKYQGMTTEELKRQIEIQLSIDKLFDKETTVSASEIDEYLQQNSQLGKNATDPSALREEIKNILRQQKTTEIFDSWFNNIRKNAKIQKFL